MTDNVNNKLENATNFNDIDTLSEHLSHYIKPTAGKREGRSIPPLDKWHPKQVIDMDLVIKANGEWWHEGVLITRKPLVSLFATVLCKEEGDDSAGEYFLKTPAQKLRIEVEDAPLLINDVGVVIEEGISWLEFTTTTGDVVRLDDAHPIKLRAYHSSQAPKDAAQEQVRPYMLVRNGLMALIGRNTFYHLTEIGELTKQEGKTILTLQSGGKSYPLAMPDTDSQ